MLWATVRVSSAKRCLAATGRGTYLCVVLADGSIFVSRDDVFTEIAPPRHRRFTLIARNDQTPLVALLRLHINLHIQHHDRAQESHSLLRHREQFRAILVELHPLDCRVEIPYLDALARADVPEADGVVGGAGGEERGAGVHVDGPEGALVAVVGAEAFAVGGEPGADYLVFGAGEEYVAVSGVSVDLVRVREGPVIDEGSFCRWG